MIRRFVLVAANLLLPLSAIALPLQLEVQNHLSEARSDVPVTWGIPLAPEENITDISQLDIFQNGAPIPVQFTVLSRWGGMPGDVSRPIAWLLADVQLDFAPNEKINLNLVASPRMDGPSPLSVISNTSTEIAISTGAATYQLSKNSFRIFDSVLLSTGESFAGGGGIRYNNSFITGPANIIVEHQGINRITLRVHGIISGNLEYTMRIHFYRNLSEVKTDFRVENLSPITWDGQGQPDVDDYGSPGSISFDDITLVIPGNNSKSYRLPTGELGAGPELSGIYNSSVSLMQHSSGDPNWNILLTEIPRLQSGVIQQASTRSIDGNTVNGANRIGSWFDANGVTTGIRKLWQNFPKTFRANVNGYIEIGLFPGEFSRNHELRVGEFKTHSVWIRHHTVDSTDIGNRARSFEDSLRIFPSIESITESRAVGIFAPQNMAEYPDFENAINYQINESPEYQERPWESAAPTLLESIAQYGHYGWVDYGDIPVDFESVEAGNGINVASPFNLKYDGLRGMVYQALRSNNETWWELAEAGAHHAADIDILHSRNRGIETPHGWAEGGMWGHGYHDERGNNNPHRNYMNPNLQMHFAQPGMVLWGFLTGDTLVLDSALELAENTYWRVVNNDYSDSGSCAALIQECSDSCTSYNGVSGGRDGGNVLKTMLSAYMVSGDIRYLDLISRAVNYLKCAEPEGCDRFHFQTTFITALGHYLLFRQWTGLSQDANALELFERRINYMVNTLWDSQNNRFRMCYDSPTLFDFHDNWLLGVADVFALGALILNRPELLNNYALPTFLDGSQNIFFENSTLAYHFTKEFVNEVGFGQAFLYVWNIFQTHPPNNNCGGNDWPANSGTQVGGNLPSSYEGSGIVWHNVLQNLFVVSDNGQVSRMDPNGSNVLTWTPGGDIEAVTIADDQSSYIYLGIEHPDSIVEFNIDTGTATGKTWNLTNWMTGPDNQGLEALAFVPNGAHPYSPSASGGLFYAGLQADGKIYVFDVNLSQSGQVSYVATITPAQGRTDIADLFFYTQTNTLFAVFDNANILSEMTLAGTLIRELCIPGNDQEGVTLLPSCPGTTTNIYITEDQGPEVWIYNGFPVSCPDTDGDGLNDNEENNLGTDPNDSDSDDDYLNDGQEVTDGTDPLDSDSDDDGMDDYKEDLAGSDPNDSLDAPEALRAHPFNSAAELNNFSVSGSSRISWSVTNGWLRSSGSSRKPSWVTFVDLDLSGLSQFMISFDQILNTPKAYLRIFGYKVNLNFKGVKRHSRHHILARVSQESINRRLKIWVGGVLKFNQLMPSPYTSNTVNWGSAGRARFDKIYVSEIPNPRIYPLAYDFADGWGPFFISGDRKINWKMSSGTLQAHPEKKAKTYGFVEHLQADFTGKDILLSAQILYTDSKNHGGLWLGIPFEISPSRIACLDSNIQESQIYSGIPAGQWNDISLTLRRGPPMAWSLKVNNADVVLDESIDGGLQDAQAGFMSSFKRTVQFRDLSINTAELGEDLSNK